jgi:hypothetical protein
VSHSPHPARTLVAACALASQLLGLAAGAESKGDTRQGGGEPPRVVYVPPAEGAPSDGRLVAAGTRGSGRRCPASVEVLAPIDHLGLTTRADPTLLWHLAEDTACPVVFTLNDPRRIEAPVVERRIEGPFRKGIHSVRLAELAVRLDPGVDYEWSVALIEDETRPSRNPVTIAFVRRVEPPSTLASGDGGAIGIAAGYAQAGIWYDAIAALEEGAARAPNDAALRRAQQELLGQVGREGLVP